MPDPIPHPDDVQKPAVVTDYRYAPIPEAVLYGELSDKAVRVYGVLMRHGLDPDHCYPSQRRIADLIGAAPRSIQRPLKELEAAGWIARKPRFLPTGDRTSDGYSVRTFSATPTRESVGGPRAGTRTPHASERGKRKQENESNRTIVGGGDIQRCALCDNRYLIEHDDGTVSECSCKLREAS